jgi:predicted glycosyltransferase
VKRILVYSREDRCVAEIERLLGAAIGVATLPADISVLVLSDAPGRDGFRLAPGIYRVHLPLMKLAERKATKTAAPEPSAARTRLIVDAVREFHPDTIVVDTAPGSADPEVVSALSYVRQHLPRIPRVLVIPAHQAASRLKSILSAPGAAEAYLYDRILTFQ